MLNYFPLLAGSQNRKQYQILYRQFALRRQAHRVRAYQQIPKRALVSAAVFCLIGLFVTPVGAQEVGDRVVVTQDTILKVNNGIVATVRKGQQFEVKHVHGDWLWVPFGKPGWIDKRFVAVVNTANAPFSEGTAYAGQTSAAASARGKAGNRFPGGPHVPVATALAIAVEEEPTVPPVRRSVPPRRPSASRRVGISFGPQGIGLGIYDPRRGSSIRFQFGGRRNRDDRRHPLPHSRE